MQKFESGQAAALSLRPDQPVYCFRPGVLAAEAAGFRARFPGKTAYAVKTNSEPMVIETLVKAGIDAFDVASPAEFAAVRRASRTAELLYMHPVKAQSDIRLALSTFAIRTLAVDHEDEIVKVHRIVRGLDIDPSAVTVMVRLQTKGHAAYELSKKFGAPAAQAVELLQRLDRYGYRLGLCFHVGSQVTDPDAYDKALASADWVRNRAGAPLAALDVGGGFPADYGEDPSGRQKPMPSAGQMMSRLKADIAAWNFGNVELVAEPGRVIVARAFSLIVRVLLRKGRRLYINDGIWASLSDSWTGRITLPARFIPDPAIRNRNGDPGKIVPYRVCGATCDSVDILSRPFWLPEVVDTGDWIEIGHIGAYSMALRTRFNGMYPDTFVEVERPYGEEGAPQGYASLETMA
jgi:ornithine decarboxylase